MRNEFIRETPSEITTRPGTVRIAINAREPEPFDDGFSPIVSRFVLPGSIASIRETVRNPDRTDFDTDFDDIRSIFASNIARVSVGSIDEIRARRVDPDFDKPEYTVFANAVYYASRAIDVFSDAVRTVENTKRGYGPGVPFSGETSIIERAYRRAREFVEFVPPYFDASGAIEVFDVFVRIVSDYSPEPLRYARPVEPTE